MNAPNHEFEQDFQYQSEKRKDSDAAKDQRASRRPQYSRSTGRPGAFNGIHRRRNKRWSW